MKSPVKKSFGLWPQCTFSRNDSANPVLKAAFRAGLMLFSP